MGVRDRLNKIREKKREKLRIRKKIKTLGKWDNFTTDWDNGFFFALQLRFEQEKLGKSDNSVRILGMGLQKCRICSKALYYIYSTLIMPVAIAGKQKCVDFIVLKQKRLCY